MLAWSFWRRWRGMRSGRCARSKRTRSYWQRLRLLRRRAFCARSSGRSSRSQTTMSRACVVDGAGARSSPPTIRRCATAGRRRRGASPAYKLHAAAASEAPILTAVSLSAGNEHDGQQAGVLVDQQPQQRRPKRVIGDTAYGNVEAREQLEARSISVLAPVHSSSAKEGAIAKEEFAIDLARETVTCPRGKTAPIYKSRPPRPNE